MLPWKVIFSAVGSMNTNNSIAWQMFTHSSIIAMIQEHYIHNFWNVSHFGSKWSLPSHQSHQIIQISIYTLLINNHSFSIINLTRAQNSYISYLLAFNNLELDEHGTILDVPICIMCVFIGLFHELFGVQSSAE